MFPRSQALNSSKFLTPRSLLLTGESPLPHSPSYLVKYRVNHPAGNRADYSPRYPVRNPESYLGGYPASYWADYLPENLVSYPEGCPDSNSADYSADCPDNRLVRNPESNRADNPPDYSADNSVGSLPDYSENYLGSFGFGPVNRPASGG